jgi:hypothetical protein
VISAEFAITRTRRDLTIGAILKWVLLGVALIAIVAQPVLGSGALVASAVLVAVAGLWLALTFRSARGARLWGDPSSLIASGQFDLAEQQIGEALSSFSIFRVVKLMSLHHLALLRHAQSRWHESAALSRALLQQQRPSDASGLGRSSRLILAESLLELGDLAGAYDCLMRLYDQRLLLREALNLLTVQLDYSARVGAWHAVLDNVMKKVDLAELLPTPQASRAQAMLALAAKKVGVADWHEWLRRRVELLVDVQKLCAERPMLWEVWRG